MLKGLSLSAVCELYEQRPTHNDLVLFIAKRLWVVLTVTFEKCELQELKGLELSDTYWEVNDPNPTNYWYMPLIQGKIVYPKLSESNL